MYSEDGEYDETTEIQKLRISYEGLSQKINALALQNSREQV